MEKDLIFFGQDGISDTKANHIANLAKLSYTDGEALLAGISFLDEKIETINGDGQKDLSYGLKDLSEIEATIERIGNLKALCAWLREAIKAHQNLLVEVKGYSIHDYTELMGIKLPEVPTRELAMTENDALAGFDVKKRNRYYWLEAMSASIGQIIHKSGPFDVARNDYYKKLSHPHKTAGLGNDMLIYTYTPSIEKEEIENVFLSLQNKYRSYQSELNSIKAEITSRITNDQIDKDRKYGEEYTKYSDEYCKISNQYNLWKAEKAKEVAALKIIIPNALKPIYEALVATEKKD